MKKKQVIIALTIIVLIACVALFIFMGAIITAAAGKFILQAGKPLQFGSYTVLIDKVEGNRLYGIKVSTKNKKFEAKSGDYLYIPEKNAVKFNLIDGLVQDFDPDNPGELRTLTFKQSYITIRLKPSLKK